jgi:glycogen phosphorylase
MDNTNDRLIESLRELAMDLHWSWNHATDKIWRHLDPMLWQLTQNPFLVLQTVSRDRITEVLKDDSVRSTVEKLIAIKQQRDGSAGWFSKNYPDQKINVAFFCMEFMLSEALPIYSGGLGNVAGDILKTASDLGLPMVGVGLLYQQGYTRQVIYPDGTQEYLSPFNDPGQLPVMPVRLPDGEWLRVKIDFPGYLVWLRTWKVQVGRITLYLLDSNDAANFPVHRGITSELYGGGAKERLLQEIVLGIGGWRLLKTLGIHPEVCHLNEGHCAFAILERALDFMHENDQPFAVALQATRSGNIFTTHTAIGAGFDLFPPALIGQYLGHYIRNNLKIPVSEFLALGRKNPADDNEYFQTGFLAMKGSGRINAVSGLHEQVSRKLFASLFPGWPLEEIPVSHVTNGVHVPTWDSPEADKLWTEACGKERWLGSLVPVEKSIGCISDERIWSMRNNAHKAFIDFMRQRYVRQLATIGSSEQNISEAKNLFDPSALTLGIARRFVNYKRPWLLLNDRNRLKNILTMPGRPVQLVVAGKAHPQDKEGQEYIKQWVQFINDFDVKNNVVFLADYDMGITEEMVQGIDVWINTPRRPWEACGTSGMKVLVNGGLNLSTADGWWDEAYAPGKGWCFGNENEYGNEEERDESDANELYALLENEIIPSFYERNDPGLPSKWIDWMRNSMASLTPGFSSVRALKEYIDNYYIPASINFRQRSEDKAKKAKEIIDRINRFSEKFSGVYFGALEVNKRTDEYELKIPVFLNGLDPVDGCVEVYADGKNGRPAFKQEMECNTSNSEELTHLYYAKLPATIPVDHYTPRITAAHKDLSVPLELNLVLWQK